MCYRYTNPLYTEHLYYMQFSGKVKLILRFPPIKKAASAMAANAAAGPALFFKVQHKIYSSTTEIVELWFGAGYGNRTRLHGLGSRCITDIRTLRLDGIIAEQNGNFNTFLSDEDVIY